MISIDKQLKRYFIIVTVVGALIIFVLSNLGMAVFFNNYVKKGYLKKDQKIVSYIEDLLTEAEQTNVEMASLHSLAQFIKGENVEVRVYDKEGRLVFDSTSMGTAYGGMRRGQGMMGNGRGQGPGMLRNMDGKVGPDSDLVFRSYPLEVKSGLAGKVEIGRNKNVLSSPEDRTFVSTMNFVYLIALVFSILVSLVISKYVTNKFLRPLHLVKNNILSIKSDGSKKLQPVDSPTAEIQQLAQATEDLAETIKKQESLRKRLTSDIAHELRTPLATLQSHLEAMIDGVWEPTVERLSFCNDEVIRLTGLIKDLNELSVLESDKIELHKTRVDLSQLAEELCENYSLIFSEKEIDLNKRINPHIFIKGDKDRLRQIIVNILSNAYKYTLKKGQVTVTLMAESSRAVLEIKDTGMGIAAEDLPHIFERFYRGDLSRNRNSGGAGIGLTITKALVEAHQGSIQVKSELGKGTEVRIEFPIESSF